MHTAPSLLQPGLNVRNPKGLPRSPAAPAVLLNRRARGVTKRQIARLQALVGAEHVHVSDSEAHSLRLAQHIIDQNYHSVLLGGGDGTFCCWLNQLETLCTARGRSLPRIGVLRLGTGNAIGHYLDIQPATPAGLQRELARARLHESPTHPLPLLRIDGRLVPFAGTGLDSQILDDYTATTRALDLVHLGALLSSPLRYALAVGMRSVPRFLLRRLPQVEVINAGGPAWAITPQGHLDPVPLPRGAVLYRGPCTLAGAATVPCYGFGVRLFPFADLRPDKFHVRCSDASALEALSHLPSVLDGTYRSPSLRDFLCDAVEIHMDAPVAMQAGGDLLPELRDFLRIELADRTVPMLCPRPPAAVPLA